jgi:hypothetical protein
MCKFLESYRNMLLLVWFGFFSCSCLFCLVTNFSLFYLILLTVLLSEWYYQKMLDKCNYSHALVYANCAAYRLVYSIILYLKSANFHCTPPPPPCYITNFNISILNCTHSASAPLIILHGENQNESSKSNVRTGRYRRSFIRPRMPLPAWHSPSLVAFPANTNAHTWLRLHLSDMPLSFLHPK